MTDFVFRRLAAQEVVEARVWYEHQSPGLGLQFAKSVEAAMQALALHPAA